MADKVEESYIFAEDVVCLKENGNSTKLGLVIKNGSNISESEDSLDSEDEEEEHVKSGELLVCWYPSGQEEVIPESKVELADRSLQPGDVVRHHVHNQRSNQKGYVTDIEITADILILGTQLVIKDVNYKQYLSPLQVLSPWTRIAFGPWVGLIKNVYRRIILWLKNGSRCCLEEEQLSMLYDIAHKRDEDSPFYDYNAEFFPSQAVVGPAKAFREAKWLSKIKPILNDQKQVKAVVEEATIVKIDVEWQVCGSCPPGCTKDDCSKPPETTINEDQLDKVRVFQHYQQAEAQIGDKGYYIVKEEDVPTKETNNTECVLKETSGAKQTKCVLSGKVNNDRKSEDMKYTDGEKESSSINEKLDGFDRDVERLAEVQAGCEDSLVDETMAVNSEATIDIEHDLIKDNFEEGHCEDDQNNKAEKDNLDSARMDDNSKAETEHISESDDGDVESDGQEQSKLKMSRQDSLSKHSTRRRRRRLRHKRKMQFTVKIKTGDRVCVEVVKTKSVAHVMWQDGHLEKDINTLDLIPTYHNDEHQFFPGYFVADKRGTGEPDSHYKSDGYGVIKYCKHDDRICTVTWFHNNGDSLAVEDDVSVYDIAEHPDFVFNPGDLVVEISGSAHEVEDVTSKGGHCVAGQVICVDKEGQVVVAWVGGSGNQRAYKPQDLYKVGSEDEDEEDGMFSDGSHSEVNSDDSDEWETASEESNGNDADNQSNLQDQSPDQLFIGLPPSEPRSPEVENVDIEALNNANNIPQGNAGAVAGFSMLSEVPTNHVFKAANEATFQPNNQRKFLSVLRKEVSLLQSSIPPGILIRGFENSMDLFSVLIQGPDDTPYEGGLFLFDIALPQDYPLSPPKVHFISYSKNSLNPNLYVDGTVCVSLLGTWNGKETEVWTPKSNILQVLLSIQGLILCKEPYYNEAGYEKHRGTVEGTENSRLYNEMAILQTIDSMGNLMRSTHPVFDREIKDHFKENGHKIIKRFKSWISHGDNLNKNNPSEEHNSAVKDTNIVSEGASCLDKAKTCKIPEFPLFPLSKGFLICLRRSIQKLLEELENTKR